jgi:putative ABC transport system permease protein
MLFKFALRNIKRNKRRSLVALSTVAVGVFGLLFLNGFFSGLIQLHTENAIHSRYGHGQVMTKGYWGQTFEKPWEHWLDKPDAVLEGLERHPAVDQVFPRVTFFSLLTNGDVTVAGRGQGIVGEKEQTFFDKMNFRAGGPLGDQGDGIVLGIGLARALGVDVGDRVTVLGNTIHGTINAIDTTVSGIFHVGLKEADDSLFQVQLDQAQILLDTNKIEAISVGLKPNFQWSNLKSDMETVFPSTEAISVFVLDEVWALNGKRFLSALLNIFRLVFLGVILLAIYNSSSNTVMERKRELGMLRANGESRGELILLLFFEGMILSVAGSALGVGMTLLVNQFVSQGIPMPPTPGTNRHLPVQLDLQMVYIFTAAILGMVTASAATFLSTTQVLRLSIVEALRTPS